MLLRRFEVDRFGMSLHRGPDAFAGIGGFCQHSLRRKTVVFCLTFNTKGLETVEKTVWFVLTAKEAFRNSGRKSAACFSAQQATKNGQRVLYVTERYVFRLTDIGLELIEAAPGIDIKRDILTAFDVSVSLLNNQNNS